MVSRRFMHLAPCFWAGGLALLSACGDDVGGTDAGAPDAARDAGASDAADAGPESAYAHVPPPAVDAPAIFQPDRWRTHLDEDLLPYWRMETAHGDPVGNFPTHRTMTGALAPETDRRPRMLARQTYAYAMSYLMTGDPELLRLAKAGVDWILEHVPDDRGGYHPVLREDGSPKPEEEKWAQDAAYVNLGLGAYYFVTRDPEAEAAILAGRDLLFDADTYWDEPHQRIRDGMSRDFTSPVDQFGDGGWELVAQLDPINAFMLLVQPVLSDPARREQFLDDLETLSQTMVDDFWQDGIFWGIHTNKGQLETRHVDFGHTLKAYWMVLQVDKRLEGNPFHDFVAEYAPQWVDQAYDGDFGRWGNRPTRGGGTDWNSSWWTYAEEDQIAATLTMGGGPFADELEQTAAHWIEDFVDDRAAKEVFDGVQRDGTPWGWSDRSTSKCFEWKNGYHSVEHALVMYLFSSWRADEPAELWFAVPADRTDFEARPYFFAGRELDRTPGDAFEIDGRSLTPVRVRFTDLY